MKKKSFYYTLALLLFAGFSAPVLAQTDTLTKPDRTNTFQDPKITNDNNSKVLIDTSNHVVDSLLDPKKSGRTKHQQPNANPMGESNKPIKIKRAPTDSGRTVKP